MIAVNVLYKNTDALKFDMNYYLNTHIPLVKKLLGAALTGATVQQGVSGGAPDSRAEFFVITQLNFASVESFQGAFGPHGAAIQGDLANFCGEPPIIQISEFRLG
jgi:uncharacterized protein (TIGR02118 family)